MKISLLLLLNLLLLVGIAFSVFNKTENRSQAKGQEILFQNLSAIHKIEIDTHRIEKTKKRWRINQNYEANSGKISKLLGMLSRMEIKRKMLEKSAQKLHTDTASLGYRIRLSAPELPPLSFQIGQSGADLWLKKQSTDTATYLVYVPGLFIDLKDYFEVSEHNWRSKKILQTSWQSLQSLSVNYTGDSKNSFKILFDSVFYRVKNVQKIDSAAVYNYLKLYENFVVQDFIEDKATTDSLQKTVPLCKITVEDLNAEQGGVLLIYPGPRGVFGQLAGSREFVRLNPKTLSAFLVNEDFFRKR